jgi:hypothetical protein
MACEHFLGGTYPLCMVVRGLMIPSLWEIRAYCTSDRPSGCPLYQRYAATQETVPVEAAVRLMGTSVEEPASRANPYEPSFRVENLRPTPIRSSRRSGG